MSIKGAGTGASPSQNAVRIPVGNRLCHYRLTGWPLTITRPPHLCAPPRGSPRETTRTRDPPHRNGQGHTSASKAWDAAPLLIFYAISADNTLTTNQITFLICHRMVARASTALPVAAILLLPPLCGRLIQPFTLYPPNGDLAATFSHGYHQSQCPLSYLEPRVAQGIGEVPTEVVRLTVHLG